MSKSSEEVLLIVKNVKNKKTDGTLYMMGERMAWMLESKNVFNISYKYADIKSKYIYWYEVLCLEGGIEQNSLFHLSRCREGK